MAREFHATEPPAVADLGRALVAEAAEAAGSFMGSGSHRKRALFVPWVLRWLETLVDRQHQLNRALERLDTEDGLALPGFHGRYDDFFRPLVEEAFDA